jgi:hypothetical protein
MRLQNNHHFKHSNLSLFRLRLNLESNLSKVAPYQILPSMISAFFSMQNGPIKRENFSLWMWWFTASQTTSFVSTIFFFLSSPVPLTCWEYLFLDHWIWETVSIISWILSIAFQEFPYTRCIKLSIYFEHHEILRKNSPT